MTAQLLAADLSTLIQDSKRKNADIRAAAEKSLSDLRALPNTSEAQLAADLKRRPNFVRPFLLSCASKNPKFAGTSISCLQRLVVSNGLAQETLKDVLDVLRDCTTLGQDIQLRILQVLPSLLQNYAGYLTGDLLATALHICFTLLLSKAAVISNTAAATSQQLVVAVLGKVALEDEIPSEEDFVAEVPLENGSVNVRSAALDAYRLLNDLCLLTEGGHKPMFLHPTAMPSNFGLELIESMLSNHAETVASHAEQIHVLRVRLMPYIIRVLSERVMFSTTVRAMRLLPIIFSKLLIVLPTECEMVLSLLNHMLDPEAASLWKRVLCMEVFRGVHADASLVRSVYAQFDELEGKRDIVRDNLAIVSRLAMEKPAIIGFGQQSTVPVSSVQAEEEVDDMAILQAEGMAGTIGVAMTLRSSTAPGISTRLSTMRVPCLDQLDKADPPTIPPAYLYTLALICMNSFSDGIARFLLPFTIPPDMKSKRKQRPPKETTDGENDTDSTQKTQLQRSQSNASSKIPVNPLSLTDNVLHSQIQTSANMIDSCWPALLAAYSTFFNAALDSDFYHALVRSFQKFTQVSGLLRASTPRDAFLTTLGKNAVPSSILPVQSVSEIKDPKRGVQTPLEKEVGTPNTRLSTESARTSLNTRNLLCLRALLNLGIALGPVLQSAWSIILETLQQADLIINYIIAQRRQSRTGQSNANINDPDLQGDIGNEITAVRKAATKLLESSNELPDESFLDIISSLSGLIRDLQGELDTISSDGLKSSSLIRPPTHSRSSSNTGIGYSSGQDPRANLFVVENIGKLIEFNKPRLLEKPPEESGWHIIANSLINVVAAQHLDPSLRKRASETLGELISLTASSDLLESIREQTRLEGLSALRRQVECLYRKTTEDNKASKVCENEIHWMSLEVLRSALEQYGDSLVSGWENVFAIISSVFGDSLSSSSTISEATARPEKARTKSSKLVRSSFGSLQLICSDFLPSVPRACFPTLLRTVQLFCIQEDEFNISLTSTTLFCNISDHLWQEEEFLDFTAIDQETLTVNGSLSSSQSSTSKPQMMLRLLLLLVDSTIDDRPEIRHSAIHSIFRIFESSGAKLRSPDWTVYLRAIILRLFAYNDKSYQDSASNVSPGQSTGPAGWNEAAIMLLESSSSIIGSFLPVILEQPDFHSVWKDLQKYIKLLLERCSLEVSAMVFTSIAKILSEVNDRTSEFLECAKLTWDIWRTENPASHRSGHQKSGDNQAALVAYLQCFTELYPLLTNWLLLEQVQSILEQLQTCATGSTPTSYSGDVDKLTPLQKHIVNCIRMIRPGQPGTGSALVNVMSYFIVLPYEQKSTSPNRNGPTFVALSLESMDLLINHAIKEYNVDEIYTSGAIILAIRALSRAISLKFKWHLEGKDNVPWKRATTTAVDLLKATNLSLKQAQMEDMDRISLWKDILSACHGIISVDPEISPQILRNKSNEEFDIEAFRDIYDLIVPDLGSPSLSDQLRRSFAESLFHNSIVHEPHPDDLPYQGEELLECLQSEHIGRTKDLPPAPRAKLSYVLLERLFDLVTLYDGSVERVKLSQAAAPYLILRVGITLKAYISDQPLRGRMPQPASQRTELLCILQKLIELKLEPKAIPDAPGVVSKHRKHLYRIYGLVGKALVVARNDYELQGALSQIIEAVTREFGID